MGTPSAVNSSVDLRRSGRQSGHSAYFGGFKQKRGGGGGDWLQDVSGVGRLLTIIPGSGVFFFLLSR